MGSKVERQSKGYAWAVAAGFTAAFAAISAKFFSSQLVKYSFVIVFNMTMWGCYINSLRALSSLQATVTNFATNFLSSGLAGFFLFGEALSPKWFAGAVLIVVGVFILSKSRVEREKSSLGRAVAGNRTSRVADVAGSSSPRASHSRSAAVAHRRSPF